MHFDCYGNISFRGLIMWKMKIGFYLTELFYNFFLKQFLELFVE